jgi:cytochrome c oxidase subunit 4
VAQQHAHKSAGAGHDAKHGHHGIGRYVAIWLILLAFTLLTVFTGRMDLGAANIFVAMVIAITKASLVVLFFMHMWEEGGVNRLVFVVSLLFAVVLILGVFGDLVTRLPMTLPNEGPLPSKLHGGHHTEKENAAPAHAPEH